MSAQVLELDRFRKPRRAAPAEPLPVPAAIQASVRVQVISAHLAGFAWSDLDAILDGGPAPIEDSFRSAHRWLTEAGRPGLAVDEPRVAIAGYEAKLLGGRVRQKFRLRPSSLAEQLATRSLLGEMPRMLRNMVEKWAALAQDPPALPCPSRSRSRSAS